MTAQIERNYFFLLRLQKWQNVENQILRKLHNSID